MYAACIDTPIHPKSACTVSLLAGASSRSQPLVRFSGVASRLSRAQTRNPATRSSDPRPKASSPLQVAFTPNQVEPSGAMNQNAANNPATNTRVRWPTRGFASSISFRSWA